MDCFFESLGLGPPGGRAVAASEGCGTGNNGCDSRLSLHVKTTRMRPSVPRARDLGCTRGGKGVWCARHADGGGADGTERRMT